MSTSKNNATLRDVARLADVSDATVSRVLSGNGRVREKTRARVLRAVDELHYVLNPSARRLAGGRSNVVGLLLPDFNVGYGAEIIRGVDDELALRGYDLMLYNAHRGADRAASYMAAIERGLADGLVVVLPHDAGPYLQTLQERRFPCTLIDHQGRNEEAGECFAVDVTNWQGAFDATQRLIDLGHRRIGFITGRLNLGCARDRLAGYRDALKANRVRFDKSLVQIGTFNQPEGYACANALLALPDRPTAIFASNDIMAFGVMESVRDHGWRIPDDISIIGFDDIPQCLMAHPPLSTVRQPLQEMGRTAVRMLFKAMDSPDQPPERVRLNTQLVMRGTCGPAPARPDHATPGRRARRASGRSRRAHAMQSLSLRR
jgi:LacI family transcriptional regulator